MKTIASVVAVLLARPRAAHGTVTLPVVSPLTVSLALAVLCVLAAAVIAVLMHRADPPRRRGVTATCGCGRRINARIVT